MPSEWLEVLSRRNRTSKTKRLYEDDQPTNKYSWDGMVGTSLHYEEAGKWLEVDPRIVPSSEPGWDWEMRKSHWRFLVRNGGWFAAEKQGVGIGFRLERVAYLNNQTKEYQIIRTASYTTPTVEAVPLENDLLPNPKGLLTWHDLFPDTDFEIHTTGDKLHEEIKVGPIARDAVLNPPYPYPAEDTALVLVYQVDWGQVPGLADDDGDIDYDIDFERQGRLYLKNHQGEIITALPASRAWAESDTEAEVPLRKRFVKVGGQHYLLVGAPVLALNALPQGTIIFDPDINKTVAANNDDGYYSLTPGKTWYQTAHILVGLHPSSALDSLGGWYRFTGISGLGGSTIDVAYISLYGADDALAPLTNIYAEEAEAPGFPTSAADGQGKDRTEDFTPWDNVTLSTVAYTDSPPIVDVIQEVVDTYDPSVIQILHDDDGSPPEIFHDIEYFESDPNKAPKLHIEFTVGGVDVTVDAVLAEATAEALIAVVTGGTGATVSGELAAAAAEGLVPVVSGGTGATVTAMLAEAVAAALLPTITGDALVTGVLATAVAEALVATITGGTGATVSAVLAEAVAAALLPTITGGALVSGELATAAAAGLVPVVTGGTGATVSATLAEAVAAALLPTITGGALVSGELATAAAAGLVPTVTGGTGVTVSAVLAEAIAAALVPTVTGGAIVSAEIATAIAEALIPVVTGEGVIDVTVYATVAKALATALMPIVTGGTGVTVSAAVATALAEALAPRILALFIQLTLESRSRTLTLESRSFALTLEPRSFALTLPTRE